MTVEMLKREYLERQEILNVRLSAVAARHGLEAALGHLFHYHTADGFSVPDEDVRRYSLGRFLAIVRLGRAARHLGAGRHKPPYGLDEAHSGCFLCRENIFWKSNGLQVGFDVTLGSPYVALCQPFPIETRHFTFAAMHHDIKGHAALATADEIRTALNDLVTLARRLPGWIAFLNGRRAGASNLVHHHLQLFGRFQRDFQFPLEIAAQSILEGAQVSATGVRVAATTPEAYPLSVLVAEGPWDGVIEQVAAWSFAWKTFEHAQFVCGNWIAVATPGDSTSPRFLRSSIAFFYDGGRRRGPDCID